MRRPDNEHAKEARYENEEGEETWRQADEDMCEALPMHENIK